MVSGKRRYRPAREYYMLTIMEKDGQYSFVYCHCGTVKRIRNDALREGKTRSCGCKRAHLKPEGIETKKCVDCGAWRPLEEYVAASRRTRKYCAACAEKSRSYANQPRTKRRVQHRKHVPEVKAKSVRWRRATASKRNARQRERYAANPECYRSRCRAWKKANRAKVTEYAMNRYRTDLRYRLKNCISRSIRQKLKLRGSNKANATTLSLLPFSIEELILHIEAKFQPGMSWSNYGKWHIDHEKPDCRFIYLRPTDEGFRQSWALSNLQPLWAQDNLKKGTKYAGYQVLSSVS